MKKISVVVPIYNSESSLERCIESILGQTYNNIELILVNDGSTDQSKRICKKYAENDSRIVFIEKENGGVSQSRNEGIKNATGEYLTFVDSDDWIESQMYEEMINELEKNAADFVLCGSIWEYSKRSEEKSNTDRIICRDRDYFIDRIYVKEDISFNLWNTIVRRNIVKDLLLKEHIWISEDNVYTLEMLLRVNKGIIMERSYYHYIQNDNSLIHSPEFTHKTLSKIYANEIQARLLKSYKLDYFRKYRHTILRDLVNTCRRMAANNVVDNSFIGVVKKKIAKEFLNGGIFSRGTIKETVINAIIIMVNYRLFKKMYRYKNGL